MKKNFYYFLPLAILLVGFFVYCSDEFEKTSPEKQKADADFVAEAKDFFEQKVGSLQTRMRTKSAGDQGFPLGEFAPSWDKSMVSSDGQMMGVDVPIVSQYKYRSIRKVEIDGRSRSFYADVTEKIVVVKDPQTEKMGVYRMLILPDYDYYQTNKGDLSEKFANFDYDKKKDFSGVILYFMVDGEIPLAFANYRDGALVDKISVFGAASPRIYLENIRKLAKIPYSLRIHRLSNLSTRSYSDESWNWDEEEEGGDPWGDPWDFDGCKQIGNSDWYYNSNGDVFFDEDGDGTPDTIYLPEVEVDDDSFWDGWPWDDWEWNDNQPNIPPGAGEPDPIGGGGGKPATPPEKKPDDNDDCGESLAGTMSKILLTINPQTENRIDGIRQHAKDRNFEYSTTVEFNPDAKDMYYPSQIITQGQSGSVNINYTDKTVLTIHNHTTNIGPSAQDIYNAFFFNAGKTTGYPSNAYYRGSVIILPNGTEYLIGFENSEFTRKHYDEFNSRLEPADPKSDKTFVNKETNDLYLEAMKSMTQQGYSAEDTYIYALSYVLDHVGDHGTGTGIKIYERKKASDSFSQTKTENNSGSYKPTKCK